ncbi:MAG: 2-iminoacetate synthase ThiH [Candidatus Omnitrophota bacterium]
MRPSLSDIQMVLSDPSPALTEDLARRAASLTRQYFGRTISLYTPLYLSNYCSSHCVYCGFNRSHTIQRKKLTAEEYRQEMRAIASTGIENILLLTGESPQQTPLEYLEKAVHAAREFFPNVALEIYPLTENGYCRLHAAGADGVTIYQETYNRSRYAQVHLAGEKKDYDFRLGAPERIARAGFHHLSLGILLGLTDPAGDIYALFQHLRALEKHYPGVEYSLSYPRLRTIKGQGFIPAEISDVTLVRILSLTRIAFPRAGINLSTRESAAFREHTLGLGVTRISAGSRTAVGAYSPGQPKHQDPQFDIADHRSVEEIKTMLKKKNFDPVLTDWRNLTI